MEQITMKACNKCGECKPATAEFWHRKQDGVMGLASRCKVCRVGESSQYYKTNAERIKEQVSRYAEANKDRIQEKQRARQKLYYMENKERIKAKNLAYVQANRMRVKENARRWYSKNSARVAETSKAWREKNAEKYREASNKREKERRASDPIFAIKKWARYTVAHALRRSGYAKESPAFHVVGCSATRLRQHIERQFLKGMNWENRDQWHIDHIIPLSTAKTEEDVIRLNHYTNLRPLWAKDNLEKSDKVLYLI